ncbi:MAG: alpha/beta fold hydrolase [Planctomycetota bacterium]|nr:alpha/beta fold hydrolase [Planctomycetota bacterium]
MTSFPRSTPATALPPPPSSNGFRAFQEPEFSVPVPELFARACESFGSRPALVGEESLTYSDLDQRSLRVAWALAAPRTGEPIAILAGPDVHFVLAALGVLRAGHAFLPLDPTQDAHLLRATLERAQVRTVIAAPAHLSRARSLHREEVLELQKLEQHEQACDLPRIDPASLACVFYTSGSTGEPVGVRMCHAFISFDVCRQTNDLSVGPEDRFDLLFSPAFSAALAPVFTALICGSSLHFLDLKKGGVGALPAWLNEHRITISNQSTSTMRAALHSVEGRDLLPELRLLCVGGEPLRARDCELVREKLHADCVLQNAMASTETRTYAQHFVRRTDTVTDPVPIGFPVLGREIRILGDDGREVAPGEGGEIVITAEHLADGYQGSPALTDARFETLDSGRVRFRTGDRGSVDSEGRMVHLGRADSIIKVRGYRVDLTEVERHLRRLHPGVEARALAFNDTNAEPAVGAVMASNEAPTLAGLRASLQEHLPDYALPVRLLALAELPQNANNKVDRRGLRDQLERMPQAPTGPVSTPQDLEAELTSIWSELLPGRGFDRATSFFDAGGDSLSAVMLLTEIERRLDKRVAHADLLRSPSIMQLAAFLESPSLPIRHIIDIPRPGARSGGPDVYLLPSITGYAPSLGNLAELSTSTGEFKWLAPIPPGEAEPDQYSISWVAQQYATEILERPPGKPIVLVGFSWGAYVAHELACILKESGAPIRLLALLDARVTTSALPKPVSWPRRGLAQLLNLPAWIRYDLLTVDLKSLQTRIAGMFAGSKEDAEPNLGAFFGRGGFTESFETDFFARFNAAVSFRPRPWRGPTAVVRARAQSLKDPRLGALGWEHFVDPAPDLYTVAGHHESFLLPPHVHKLARDLDRYLAEE